MKRALEGIRVIDMSHVLAAPTTTMFLADLGAEVIHLEPPHGDDAREYGPFAGEPGKNRSGYFISLNRNKKSLVLNLKLEKGREILRELIQCIRCDHRELSTDSTMKKMGFGWEEIRKMNPRIIYAAISGFGHDSPPDYASRASYDMVAQAYSGLMSITGPVGGPPCRVGPSVGDIIAGQQAVIGILAALSYREKTGRGQFYDGSMVDGLFAVLESAVARYTITGKIPGPLGGAHPSITPFEAFRTKDSWIIVAAGNDSLWAKLCRILNREDLIHDPSFREQPPAGRKISGSSPRSSPRSWSKRRPRSGSKSSRSRTSPTHGSTTSRRSARIRSSATGTCSSRSTSRMSARSGSPAPRSVCRKPRERW